MSVSNSVETQDAIRLCQVADVAEGNALQINLPERPPLAVFKIEGQIFVTDDTCTHGQASLCEGEIEDGVVECPFHQGAFEIATGKAISAPCSVHLKTYQPIILRLHKIQWLSQLGLHNFLMHKIV